MKWSMGIKGHSESHPRIISLCQRFQNTLKKDHLRDVQPIQKIHEALGPPYILVLMI